MLLFYLSLIDTPEDKLKFEKIYEKYRKLMMYVALKILNNRDLSEDAVHDAFLKIIYHLDEIEEISCHKTKAYIVIVIRCTALDILKKEKKYEAFNFDEAEEYQISDSNITDNLTFDEIIEKVKQLPKIYYDVLALKIYQELSDKEIAVILNISHSAVRKRLQRARAILGKTLKN